MRPQISRTQDVAVTQLGVNGLKQHTLSSRCRLASKLGRPICARDQTQTQAQAPTQTQAQQQPQEKRDLVRSLPPVRPAAPPPEAVAVQHSSSYLYRQRREELGVDPDASMLSYLSSSERSWREDARDVNMTAANGIANAAKATANASGKVLSVAVPVGGWALRQGFKAAKGALKRNSAKQSGASQRSGRSADDSE